MRTFQWLSKQGVEAPGEFVLQCVDRFQYHYVEGETTYSIPVEACFAKKGKPKGHFLEIFADSITSTADETEVPISRAERDRILPNVSDAMEFMAIQHVIKTDD